MDASCRGYYADLLGDKRMLRDHGFGAWPDHDDIVRYACDIDDAVRAIADHLGCDLERDPRGGWTLVRRGAGR
ncbi:MAG: hypothetical protein IJ111_10815 [Eggerthellaceae bacterium]|nr:hypothetical protein [Eggerthellaceae bacterium]